MGSCKHSIISNLKAPGLLEVIDWNGSCQNRSATGQKHKANTVGRSRSHSCRRRLRCLTLIVILVVPCLAIPDARPHELPLAERAPSTMASPPPRHLCWRSSSTSLHQASLVLLVSPNKLYAEPQLTTFFHQS